MTLLNGVHPFLYLFFNSDVRKHIKSNTTQISPLVIRFKSNQIHHKLLSQPTSRASIYRTTKPSAKKQNTICTKLKKITQRLTSFLNENFYPFTTDIFPSKLQNKSEIETQAYPSCPSSHIDSGFLIIFPTSIQPHTNHQNTIGRNSLTPPPPMISSRTTKAASNLTIPLCSSPSITVYRYQQSVQSGVTS